MKREELAACLAALGHLDDPELDPADRLLLERAVTSAARKIKQRAKARRSTETRAADRALLSAATRFHTEIPATAPAADPAGPPIGTLRRARRCYVCKSEYRQVDADYHLLCPACAEENRTWRYARTDLTGRTAIVTGGRVKIGFHTALKLLRDGASVVVTTRFPVDAARRFAAVTDFAEWSGRLHVYGLDLLDLAALHGFVGFAGRHFTGLDILVNNAAQTLYRPPAYHRELRAAEAAELPGAAAQLVIADSAPAAVQALFPAGLVDETGQPLDLRPVNSWTLRDGDVSPHEWLSVHVVNAFAPFLLTSRLRPLLAAGPPGHRHVVQVSAMEGSFSRTGKTVRHPHTNMAKASLNMLVRTSAADYATDGILMNAVDTGWVTDERPHPDKQRHRAAGFRPPLDVIDGAARVYHPIVTAARGEPIGGEFLKDYRSVPW
ncbi:SDR family oxidoreductase [Actinoplanes regularis]|uniref:SDR family oxidoreductase n=1 Tax=Actinoplanes regularis TaxID=52697 RepID=UPI0024A44838|nr:SDR family oxidoreductase [Actinoplanes regularis]GLW35439.1 oxidoreductase [Actinoplanes regularis]